MSRRDCLTELRSCAPVVLPSLLSCDFSNLEREVRQLEQAGATALHLDVMDGHFVPNLTFGMPIVAALRRLTELTLDVHLMISDPARYAKAFCEAGADCLTFHVEAVKNPRSLLQQIHDLDMVAGLTLNPNTPLSTIEGCLDLCDLVLVMSVEAGFGGQAFQPIALEKLEWLRRQAGDRVLLEVDGGVNQDTIAQCARAGAQLFVVGSAFFAHDDYRATLQQLTHLAVSP